MGVISAAKQPPGLEALEERGVEVDGTALRRTGRTPEVHLRTFIKKTRHRSRSSTTELVVQGELGLLLVSEAGVVAAVVAGRDAQGVLAEEVATLHVVVAMYAAAEGLEDEVIGADGGTGKR